MMGLPAGTRIWIVAGVTDMRRGFVGLAGTVQTALEENPFLCDGGESVAPTGHARERSSPNYFRTTHIIPAILPFIDQAISQVV